MTDSSRNLARTTAAGVLAASWLFAAPSIAQQASSPPVAPVRPITDTYFGTKVVDPYQWMENLKDPEVVAWFKGQANYTKSVLDRIPGRDVLLKRITALDNAGQSVASVQIGGNRYFYLKTDPGFTTDKLFVRDGVPLLSKERVGVTLAGLPSGGGAGGGGLPSGGGATGGGTERLLVDPEKLAKNGVHYAIDYFTPSYDGRYVAYAMSPGGSEDSVLSVMDVRTGRNLSDRIDRAEFGDVAWRTDGRSFFYVRLQKLAAAESQVDRYKKSCVYLHRLGSDPDTDRLIFGYGVSPHVPMTEDDDPQVFFTPASPFLFGIINHGVSREETVYAAPISSVGDSVIPWHKIADTADDVVGLDAHGGTVFLQTHKNTPRFKIIVTTIDHPDLTRAGVLVPEGRSVIIGLGAAQDALYVQTLDGGIGRLLRVPYVLAHRYQLDLPYDGNIPAIVTYGDRPGLVFLETGWTHSSLWYAYNPDTDRITDTGLKRLSRVSFRNIASREVKAKAADGTLIPLSIIYAKNTELDGSHPTLMEGYGAYGITIDPSFSPMSLAWLERGGVLAFAHVRGGGEYGEDWHHAGMLLTKYNTWRDFIACANYLIDKGYTSPKRMAIEGASAGGITVGRALTERPDLFGAVIDDVGVSNPLRQELSPNGPPNIPEFGTFHTQDGFKALSAMDAYHHVKDGTKYPAVLLLTGINDPRVSSWEPAKMTARLQAATASGKPVLLRVDYDAGHGIGSTKTQEDSERADEYTFLFWQLGVPGFQPPLLLTK